MEVDEDVGSWQRINERLWLVGWIFTRVFLVEGIRGAGGGFVVVVVASEVLVRVGALVLVRAALVGGGAKRRSFQIWPGGRGQHHM